MTDTLAGHEVVGHRVSGNDHTSTGKDLQMPSHRARTRLVQARTETIGACTGRGTLNSGYEQ
ncbi:hypothetical protein ACFY5F_21735 [Streptomyces sp. NPDC013161]|uniref:hypothetical protein n=1 Tax=Streptomyces sp. NPDC013161 TaxID=3364862 RepID=UPI0036B023E1